MPKNHSKKSLAGKSGPRGPIGLAASSLAGSARFAEKIETLLDEAIATLRAARPVLEAVGKEIEDGLLDDVRALLASVPETQEDVRVARASAERIAGVIDGALSPLGAVPGAKLAKRVTRSRSAKDAPDEVG
ncbi:MAG: hypothetical protein QM621_03810 [Aeromicrobium sp.]|uniref:hypothetical protein n=1 Tax=Aeromicrobium sp. TaxID=1871063 RepID=UPI0039E3D677